MLILGKQTLGGAKRRAEFIREEKLTASSSVKICGENGPAVKLSRSSNPETDAQDGTLGPASQCITPH